MSNNITITFPDGNTKSVKKGISAFELASQISKSLAKESVAIKIDESIKEKKDLEKVVLCDVPNLVYPDLEKSFLDMMHNSGFPNIKLEKKIDFTKLYLERFN